VGYLLAVTVQIVVAAITRLLLVAFPTFAFPGMIEVLTVALIAVSWGAGPGVLAAIIGLGLEEIVVLPVRAGEARVTPGDLTEGMVFMAVGLCITIVAAMTEHSRRRAVEERAAVLQQAQDRMDEFLAIASHDLRSPLTALSGYLDLATRSYSHLASTVEERVPDLVRQTERLRADLEAADESSERLQRLVEVLFDTSRARADTLELNTRPCDLVQVVREQAEAAQMAAPQRVMRLSAPAGTPLVVLVDGERIGQVISNYLTNAVKYSPATQPIDAWVGIADGKARVAVTDRGSGLPEHERERVWQRFYRAEGIQVQSGARGSLGLGLHICKAIVEAHGGSVGVQSEVGHGSTFWFELPTGTAEHVPPAV
jgi:signal transduction histidine kinase